MVRAVPVQVTGADDPQVVATGTVIHAAVPNWSFAPVTFSEATEQSQVKNGPAEASPHMDKIINEAKINLFT